MDAVSEYRCPVYSSDSVDAAKRAELLVRPVKSSADILALVSPILDSVRNGGDEGLRACVVKFDRCLAAEDTTFPLTLKAPFPAELAPRSRRPSTSPTATSRSVLVPLSL